MSTAIDLTKLTLANLKVLSAKGLLDAEAVDGLNDVAKVMQPGDTALIIWLRYGNGRMVSVKSIPIDTGYVAQVEKGLISDADFETFKALHLYL